MSWIPPNINPRNLAAVMLTGVICLVITEIVTAALIRPAGTVQDTVVVGIFDLLKVTLGLVGGWLLGSNSKPPTEPPKETKL